MCRDRPFVEEVQEDCGCCECWEPTAVVRGELGTLAVLLKSLKVGRDELEFLVAEARRLSGCSEGEGSLGKATEDLLERGTGPSELMVGEWIG